MYRPKQWPEVILLKIKLIFIQSTCNGPDD